MPIEEHVRSVGTKGVTYPWLRRYIVIGPYNRHFRRDAAASVVAEAIVSGAQRARRLRTRLKNKAT